MKNKVYFITCLAGLLTLLCSCSKRIDLDFVEIEVKNIYGHYNIYVSRTEITRGFYNTINHIENNENEIPELPVTGISFIEACEFCNKLSSIAGLKKYYSFNKISDNEMEVLKNHNSNGFRLLTDYEIISISQKLYHEMHYGDPKSHGWCGTRLHKVAHRLPDSLGLFDFIGNASEMYMTEDEYADNVIKCFPCCFDNSVLVQSEEYYDKQEEKYYLSKEEVEGFRICCPSEVRNSVLNLISPEDIEKQKNEWILENVKRFTEQLQMIDVQSVETEIPGNNINGTDTIKVRTPSLKVSSKKVSKAFYDFIIYDALYDGIEEPDYDECILYNENIKKEDYIHNDKEKTNVPYIAAYLFCSKLNEYCNIVSCYDTKHISDIITFGISGRINFDFAENGYRLPTYYEWLAFEKQNQIERKVKMNPKQWELTSDSYTEQKYTTDVFAPCVLLKHNGNVRIVRYSGEDSTPVSIKMDSDEINGNSERESPNFTLRLFQTADKYEYLQYQKEYAQAGSVSVIEDVN